VRVFNKENSVFAAWKEDTSSSLKLATQTDFSEWKVDRVIKDEKDVSMKSLTFVVRGRESVHLGEHQIPEGRLPGALSQ